MTAEIRGLTLRHPWVTIPAAPDYEITIFGDIRSKRRETTRYLRPYIHDKGYLRIRLLTVEGRKSFLVHQLVLEAFGFPNPGNLQVRHLDGNPSNNHVVNLQWGTIAENYSDRIKHGTTNRGGTRFNKLTPEQVIHIRASDLPTRQLGKQFGVSRETVRKIKKGAKWAWL